MSVRSTIMPPRTVNSGSGAPRVAKSRPSTRASNGTGSSTRPDVVEPCNAGRVIGVVGIGPEADFAIGLQEVDHARRVVQECVGHLGSQAIADSALQIAQSLRAGVGGFVVAGIGDPYGTRRARRGAADGFGLFDQHNVEAQDGGAEGRRHAAGSGAQHQQIHFRGYWLHCSFAARRHPRMPGRSSPLALAQAMASS